MMPLQVCNNSKASVLDSVETNLQRRMLTSYLLHIQLTQGENTLPFIFAFTADTFDPKKFFEMVGMKAMSAENVKKVFLVLDVDGSGFIEEEELK